MHLVLRNRSGEIVTTRTRPAYAGRVFLVLWMGFFLSVVLGIFPGACKERTDRMEAMISQKTHLAFSIKKVEENKLSISYALRNNSTQSLLVFNRLYAADSMGNIKIKPDRFYIYPENDATLAVTKRVMPIPAGREVESPEVSMATLLEPGRELSETRTLVLPLKMDTPYGSDGDMKLSVFKSLSFSLGVAPLDDALPVRRGKVDGAEVLTLPYGPAMKNQVILTAEPVTIKLQALIR